MSPFFKLQATGNDFIFVLGLQNSWPKEKIAKLCNRRFGIGADGFVSLKPTAAIGYDFQWDFYNADGSSAEMCGNAARCATLLVAKEFKMQTVRIKTAQSEFTGKILNSGEVFVDFPIPHGEAQNFKNIFNGQFPSGFFINTGVPHCVIPVDQLADVNGCAADLKRYIFDPFFGPQGSNLTFMSEKTKGTLDVVTLERGVNDFTLSCGTGVAAAVKVYTEQKKRDGAVEVFTPGGKIIVELNKKRDHASLQGGAQIVFKGEIE